MPKLVIKLDVAAALTGADLTDFPVPILSSSLSAIAQSLILAADSGNGADVWFSSDQAGATQITAVDLVHWSDADSRFMFVVQRSVLAASGATLYLHVGDKPAASLTSPYPAEVRGDYPLVSDANDRTSNANNGTAQNGLIIGGVTGPDGILPATAYDGVNDYVSVADHATLDITGALTLSARVRPTGTTADDEAIVAKWFGDGSNQLSYGLIRRQDNTVRAVFSPDGTSGNAVTVTSPAALTLGEWVSVAASYEPSTAVRLYIDGVEVASNAVSVPAALHSGTADLWLGIHFAATGSPNNRFFSGDMAAARVEAATRTADWLLALTRLTGPNASTYVSASNVGTRGSSVFRSNIFA